MLNKREIIQIIRNKIIKTEQPGDHVGGSGHLTDVSINIEKIELMKTKSGWEIEYEYTISYLSEFDVVLPDDESKTNTQEPSSDEFLEWDRNRHYRKKAIMDQNGNILEDKRI